MKIVDILYSEGLGGFFYDDQQAIRSGAVSDGFAYAGTPVTPGFSTIRMPARTLGIGVVLEDGAIVWGDMMSVQYAGSGGRDPVFDPVAARKIVERTVAPRLLGQDVAGFRDLCAAALLPEQGDTRLPLAIEYGVSQALLRAAAHVRRRLMVEVICDEFALPSPVRRVPIYAQSGDSREINVDKMILKRVDIMPHGLINSLEKFGQRGETLLSFANLIKRRIATLAGSDYAPILHFDVYGCMGIAFDRDIETIADYIAHLADLIFPLVLQVESPVDFGSRAGQIDGLAAVRGALRARGVPARIVADEWCNTLEDVEDFCAAGAADIIQIKTPDLGTICDTIRAARHCAEAGMGAYIGGSCVETELSAQVSTHIAIATQADMMLAKPGMGVDEALTIVGNEQGRVLAALERGLAGRGAPA